MYRFIRKILSHLRPSENFWCTASGQSAPARTGPSDFLKSDMSDKNRSVRFVTMRWHVGVEKNDPFYADRDHYRHQSAH